MLRTPLAIRVIDYCAANRDALTARSYSAELDFDVSACARLELGRSFSYTGGKDGIVATAQPHKSLSELTLAPYSINIVELNAPH